MNDFSEQGHCHLNTFVNRKFAGDNTPSQLLQADELCDVAEADESSNLGSNLDTYQGVITPAKRARRHL